MAVSSGLAGFAKGLASSGVFADIGQAVEDRSKSRKEERLRKRASYLAGIEAAKTPEEANKFASLAAAEGATEGDILPKLRASELNAERLGMERGAFAAQAGMLTGKPREDVLGGLDPALRPQEPRIPPQPKQPAGVADAYGAQGAQAPETATMQPPQFNFNEALSRRMQQGTPSPELRGAIGVYAPVAEEERRRKVTEADKEKERAQRQADEIARIREQGGFAGAPTRISQAEERARREAMRPWYVGLSTGKFTLDTLPQPKNQREAVGQQDAIEAWQAYEAKERALDIKATGSGGKKTPTRLERRDAGFARRLSDANNIIDQLEEGATGYERTLTGSEGFPNVLRKEDERRLRQAAANFLAAIYRHESGAQVKESEWETGRQEYLPQPGDTPAILQQKSENRSRAFSNMATSSGAAWFEPPVEAEGLPDTGAQAGQPPRPAAQQRGVGYYEWGGQQYRVDDPADIPSLPPEAKFIRPLR